MFPKYVFLINFIKTKNAQHLEDTHTASHSSEQTMESVTNYLTEVCLKGTYTLKVSQISKLISRSCWNIWSKHASASKKCKMYKKMWACCWPNNKQTKALHWLDRAGNTWLVFSGNKAPSIEEKGIQNHARLFTIGDVKESLPLRVHLQSSFSSAFALCVPKKVTIYRLLHPTLSEAPGNVVMYGNCTIDLRIR